MRTGVMVCLVAALLGCEPEKSPAPDTTSTVDTAMAATRSGVLLLAGDTLRFIDCGASGEGRVLADRPDGEATRLIAEFAPADGRVTALVRIDHDSLREIRYAGLEGPGCGDVPPAGVLRASGTEPFWQLAVVGDSATLRTPEDTAGTVWRSGVWQSPSAVRRTFVATRAGDDTLTMALTLTRCADGMSGARFPLLATLTRKGVTMRGCALEGRNAGATLP